MFMREDEAKEKWCPFRIDNCIASRCACWRWDPNSGARIVYEAEGRFAFAREERDAGPKPGENWKFFPHQWGRSAHWLEPEEEARARREGYYGLAGKP